MSEKKPKGQRVPTADDLAFGRHMRSCRRARGLTQETLAECSQLSADTIRRLEHGSFSPSLDTLRKLSHGMRLELSTVFAGFELRERDVAREVVDAVSSLTVEEQQMLLRLLNFVRLLAGQKF